MIYWFISAPWVKCSLLASLLHPQSIILCVLPHLQRKMVAGLSTAMTDGSLCVCACFCVFFYSFIPQRSLSQAQSIQRHCLTTTFNPMGPTGLGCEVSDWSKEASLIFMHQTHKASQREVFEKCIIIPPH